jgi:hypothetical protein
MALKRIGAFWENQDPKSKTRYSGKIELGALGDIDVVIFDNEKQEEKHPDLTLHLITGEKPENK